MRLYAAVLGCRWSSQAAQSRSPQGIGLQDATSKRCPSGSSHVGMAAPGCCCSVFCTQEHPGLVACPENFAEGENTDKTEPAPSWAAANCTHRHKLAQRRPRLQRTAWSQQTDRRALLLALTNGSVSCPRGRAGAGVTPIKAQTSSGHRRR